MRNYRLISAMAACALGAPPALAQDPPRPSWIDVTLTYYVAGQALGAFHEAGHAGAAILTGGGACCWRIHLFHQSVQTSADRRWKSAVISLAGPVTARLLHELPRWIAEPTADGRYYRFAASFAFVSRIQLISTSPIFHFWHGRDLLSVANAVTDDRAGRIAVATGLTLVAIADVLWQWDELKREWRIFSGRTRFPGGTAAHLTTPVAIPLVTIRF